MRKLYVMDIELSTGDRDLHIVNVPEMTDKDFYRQTRSYSSFFWVSKKKNQKNGKLFVAYRPDEHKLECKGALHTPPKLTIEHEGIWAFYEAIGEKV